MYSDPAKEDIYRYFATITQVTCPLDTYNRWYTVLSHDAACKVNLPEH